VNLDHLLQKLPADHLKRILVALGVRIVANVARNTLKKSRCQRVQVDAPLPERAKEVGLEAGGKDSSQQVPRGFVQ
jgi:hypothetical protein